MDWQDVIVGIRLAQASIDQELGARIEEVHERFTCGRIAALEACDRVLLDVADEGMRRELERVVEELAEICAQGASAVLDVCTSDLFDPLRVLVADVRHEQRMPSPVQRA